MKLIDLTLWILVIFLIPGSFAQLTQTSETPTQGAFEIGFNQPPQGTETPTQQAFAVGANQTTPVAQKTVLPRITIISPIEGSMNPSGNLTVAINVTNFTLVNMLGAKSVPGEGHLHYYIDVAVPKTPGKPAVTAIGTFAPTANTTWTWPNVKAGKHNLSVQLANNDHTPVIPVVYNTVNVTVTAPTLKTMSVMSVTIDLVAKNLSFNTTKIAVPAGANVTVNFDNQDTYVPHNFAVYTDASAKTAIYQGKNITGPAKVNYTFTAPKPGSYFFRCDVHPTTMTGQFIVQ